MLVQLSLLKVHGKFFSLFIHFPLLIVPSSITIFAIHLTSCTRMLSCLRCVFCCVDEEEYTAFDYHDIPDNYNTFTTTTPTSTLTAQTYSTNYSQSSFDFPPRSHSPVVFDRQRETLPKVNVKVESSSSFSNHLFRVESPKFSSTSSPESPYVPVFSPAAASTTATNPVVKVDSLISIKETPTETHTKRSSGQYLSNTSSSNLPFKVVSTKLASSSSLGAFLSTSKSPSVANKPILSPAAASTTATNPVVKVDSLISIKETPTETHTKRSSGQYLSNTSSSNLPFKVVSTKLASSSSLGAFPSTSKSPSVANKPILSRAANASTKTSNNTKNKYNLVEKDSTPLYLIPEDIKSLIKQDIVPGVIKRPLSPQTYKDYFAALLYAEDYYLEKWDGFQIKNVPLKLHEAEVHSRKDISNNRNKDVKDDKTFVEFAINSIPEKRPFLLSRDLASVQPSGRKTNTFTGIISRVVKSNFVLVEFGDDFHSQHYSSCKYDVKFLFNRVCLKRAHQAIAAASDMLFTNFLFPECRPKDNSKKVVFRQNHLSSQRLDSEQVSAVNRILNHNGPPPYLLEGPLSVTIKKQLSRTMKKQLSRTGMVIREAIVELCQASPASRILICAPLNSTCDVLMRSLLEEVGDSNIFRANAAFRELDGVPIDILPFCPYKEKEECFSCPSLPELQAFKVIVSTFMSSYRLHNEGIESGHFSHIFLVDASSATEPEVLVPLTNLANESTNVVVTGTPRKQSSWIRSEIARRNGLKISYFERLCGRELYRNRNPESITQLVDEKKMEPVDLMSKPGWFRNFVMNEFE